MSEKITEKVIMRVAHMLSFGVDRDGIRDTLLHEGLCEYEVFLAFKAGETYNLIDCKEYQENEVKELTIQEFLELKSL